MVTVQRAGLTRPKSPSINPVKHFALEIEIILSSNGWRITSSTERLNSGNSSKWKDLPHCNSLIVSHKAPIATKICTIKPFTTTKVVQIFDNGNLAFYLGIIEIFL